MQLDEDLFRAVEGQDFRKAGVLLQKGANPGWLTRDGISALHLAAGTDNKYETCDFIESCLKLCANPNLQSTEGLLTPVHIAASWGLSGPLKLLLLHGGDPDILDGDGLSAIEYAYRCTEPGAEECIRVLLDMEKFSNEGSRTSDCYPDSAVEEVGEDESFSTFISANDTISFPKLHPWTTSKEAMDSEETILYNVKNLTLEDSQPSDSDEDTLDATLVNETLGYDWKNFSCLELDTSTADLSSNNSSIAIPQKYYELTAGEVKDKLHALGDYPGPIVNSTKLVYIKRLVRLEKGDISHKDSPYKDYLPELRGQLERRAPTPDMLTEEESMCLEFRRDDLREKWREGFEKSSFNYLLLDPRVTQNLPTRHRKMDMHDCFACFISSVFYVGKGKRSRPYAHLQEALKDTKKSAKVQHIQDIWAANLGVVSLHCFQSVIPVEAYTREACMMDALGLSRLTNQKRGDYYGRSRAWTQKKKRDMGVFLLNRAFKIFLSEGERQIRPGDLKGSRSNKP